MCLFYFIFSHFIKTVMFKYKLYNKIHFRVFKNIGCPNGCGDGYRGSMGDHLRAQGMHCFNHLLRTNSKEFKRFLHRNLVKKPLQEVIDFLHAFLGFCVDPGAFSPQGWCSVEICSSLFVK